MVTEKMIEAAKLFDDMSPEESIGAFGGSGQWVELCTVRDLRKLESALSTDAEPVAWQFRCEIFPEWQTTDQKPGDQLQMEYETGVNMNGLEVRGLYAAPPQPAPSVAVKEGQR